MSSILLIDPAVGTGNLGDEIISECARKELSFLTKEASFTYTVPSHLPVFHWYAVLRNSSAVKRYGNCTYKFACGSNMMVKNLLTHYPQWNLNLFNYKPLKGTVLVGVGAGAGSRTNAYTRYLYRHLLSSSLYHSVRDERSKQYVESLGLKAINTGCVTMWALTPEFCSQIPSRKADEVVFTLTAPSETDPKDDRDQLIIDVLKRNYSKVYYWPQAFMDKDYIKRFSNTDGIEILEASRQAYHDFLETHQADYVGTRLHGGIYAMRHKKRSIIIAIDERARGINESNNLNCVDKNNLEALEPLIGSEFATDVKMDQAAIAEWKKQFKTI